LGLFVFKLPVLLVYSTTVLGNFFIVPFVLIFLKSFSEFLMHRIYFFNRFLNYIFSKTRDKHSKKFKKWEHWALVVLVAVPLPFTGAWTGAVAAFLFGIPFKKALWLILLGIAIAGLIVSTLSLLSNNFI
jgi:uncharacterized membrane protein